MKYILFIFFVFNLFSCSFHNLHSLKIYDRYESLEKNIEIENISLDFKEWETQYMFFPIPLIFYNDNNNDFSFAKPKYEEIKIGIEFSSKLDYIKINNLKIIIYNQKRKKEELLFDINKEYKWRESIKIPFPNKYRKSKFDIKIILNITFKNNNIIKNSNYIYWCKYENYFCIFPYPIGGWGV